MKGSCLPDAKFSLQLVKILLRYAMGTCLTCSGMHFGYLAPETVIFNKFGPACMHPRPLDYLDVLALYRAHVSCACPCIMHARHDTTFAYNANHVIMMSSAFAFHSCHVGVRWHDIIGVHLA